MNSLSRLLFAAAALTLGCYDTSTVAPNEVFVVTACPADYPCVPVADGRSLVTVEVCIPEAVNPRKKPLDAVFALSAGRWQVQTDAANPRAYTASLAANPCTYPAFVTTTDPGPVRVDVTVAGVQQSIFVQVEPADLRDVTLAATPTHLTTGASADLTVTAVVRAIKNGKPSIGTDVRFEVVDVYPPGAFAAILPARVNLADDGSASAHLSTASAVTQVSVKATAEPPEDSLGEIGETVTATLPLTAVP